MTVIDVLTIVTVVSPIHARVRFENPPSYHRIVRRVEVVVRVFETAKLGRESLQMCVAAIHRLPMLQLLGVVSL
jgi:hypothetical protein